MAASAEFSHPTQLVEISKGLGKPGVRSRPIPISVSLIRKGSKSGDAFEKISFDEPDYQSDGWVDFIETAPAMELRRRYKAEASSHRNMLARRKSGKIVHSDFIEFRSFLRHVGPMPGKGVTLDRIDNNDPEYAPGKVRWADRRTQNNNKSDTLTFYYSRTRDVYTASRLAKLQNVSAAAIRKRRREGWTDDEIIEGKRSISLPQAQTAKEGAAAPVTTSRFPVDLYSPRQLALLSRSEVQLTSAADIQFHRDAHHHQWHREEHGEEGMLPTYDEFHEIFEEHAAGITREHHKRHILRWWKTNRCHVVYRNLKPQQKAMIAEYDPEWSSLQDEQKNLYKTKT